MNKDKIWNIILIISIILIIHGLAKTGSTDKKEAQAGQDQTTIGAIGATTSFIMKKTNPWLIFLAVSASLPFIFTQYKSLFFPPSIPGWVYGAGFLVLFLMVTRRK